MEIYVSKSRVPVIEVQSPSWFRNRPPMFPKAGNLAKKNMYDNLDNKPRYHNDVLLSPEVLANYCIKVILVLRRDKYLWHISKYPSEYRHLWIRLVGLRPPVFR